jgi:hypothetical protein
MGRCLLHMPHLALQLYTPGIRATLEARELESQLLLLLCALSKRCLVSKQR